MGWRQVCRQADQDYEKARVCQDRINAADLSTAQLAASSLPNGKLDSTCCTTCLLRLWGTALGICVTGRCSIVVVHAELVTLGHGTCTDGAAADGSTSYAVAANADDVTTDGTANADGAAADGAAYDDAASDGAAANVATTNADGWNDAANAAYVDDVAVVAAYATTWTDGLTTVWDHCLNWKSNQAQQLAYGIRNCQERKFECSSPKCT